MVLMVKLKIRHLRWLAWSYVWKAETSINDLNNIIGHKKCNIKKIDEIYNTNLIIRANDKIKRGKFKITLLSKFSDFLDDNK